MAKNQLEDLVGKNQLLGVVSNSASLIGKATAAHTSPVATLLAGAAAKQLNPALSELGRFDPDKMASALGLKNALADTTASIRKSIQQDVFVEQMRRDRTISVSPALSLSKLVPPISARDVLGNLQADLAAMKLSKPIFTAESDALKQIKESTRIPTREVLKAFEAKPILSAAKLDAMIQSVQRMPSRDILFGKAAVPAAIRLPLSRIAELKSSLSGIKLDSLAGIVSGLEKQSFAAISQDEIDTASKFLDKIENLPTRDQIDKLTEAVANTKEGPLQKFFWIVLTAIITWAVTNALNNDTLVTHGPQRPAIVIRELRNTVIEYRLPPEILEEYRVVSKNYLIPRASRRRKAPPVGFLYSGEIVVLIERQKKQCLIEWHDEIEGDYIQGWVPSKYLRRVARKRN